MGMPVHLHMLCAGALRPTLLLLAAGIRTYVYNGKHTVYKRIQEITKHTLWVFAEGVASNRVVREFAHGHQWSAVC